MCWSREAQTGTEQMHIVMFSEFLTVSSSSCIPLGMAVGWAPWESRPRIHQLGQGSLPSSSEGRKWHLTGLGTLRNLGGPGFWAKEVQAGPQGHGWQAMATSSALIKWGCPVLLGFLDG